jgi:hypothetical protein
VVSDREEPKDAYRHRFVLSLGGSFGERSRVSTRGRKRPTVTPVRHPIRQIDEGSLPLLRESPAGQAPSSWDGNQIAIAGCDRCARQRCGEVSIGPAVAEDDGIEQFQVPDVGRICDGPCRVRVADDSYLPGI